MNKRVLWILPILGVFVFSAIAFAADADKGSAKEPAEAVEAEVPDVAKEAVQEAIEKGEMKKSDTTDWGVPISAKAIIKGTQEELTISGSVDFVQTGDGLQVVASLSNVPDPGKHGIHIHAEGSCEDGGKAAGGHYNPAGTDHGLLPRDGHGKSHTGDMGNIEIDEAGNGSLVLFMPGLSLSDGHRNVAGKAVILHEKEDDFGQPTGNAGARIGCGIIALNN